HNLLNPANGAPICAPTQDMVLGIYILTSQMANDVGDGKIFGDLDEIVYAVESGSVGLRARVSVLYQGKMLQTTPGRVIFNSVLPTGYPYVNRPVSDKEVTRIISEVYDKFG